MGISELNAVRSYIRLILVHLMKAISAPEAAALAHWQEEVANWQSELLQRVTPAMKEDPNRHAQDLAGCATGSPARR